MLAEQVSGMFKKSEDVTEEIAEAAGDVVAEEEVVVA